MPGLLPGSRHIWVRLGEQGDGFGTQGQPELMSSLTTS